MRLQLADGFANTQNVPAIYTIRRKKSRTIIGHPSQEDCPRNARKTAKKAAGFRVSSRLSRAKEEPLAMPGDCLFHFLCLHPVSRQPLPSCFASL